jgi:anti-sigma-K factor RskA
VTYDDDKEALAAEYVLGTLSADERDQAEALLSIDPRFEEAVRQWERRLGELNVMVEAVEPPPEVWDKVRASINPHAQALPTAADDSGEGLGLTLPQIDEAELRTPPELPSPEGSESAATELASALGLPVEPEPSLTSPTIMPPVNAPSVSTSAPTPSETAQRPAPSTLRAEPKLTGKVERGADVIYLARRVQRWRRLTLLCGAIAALLAIYVGLWQVAPDLIPAQLRPTGGGLIAQGAGPVRAQQDRLVAVLQLEPTAPAFLLTLDTRNRTVIVRRVSATPEKGHSYQLWLISKKFPNPRSLGVLGDAEFTQGPLPASYDIDTLRSASYAVSLEPSGGSPSGVPTGPVLFTGNAVESLPATPPLPST